MTHILWAFGEKNTVLRITESLLQSVYIVSGTSPNNMKTYDIHSMTSLSTGTSNNIIHWQSLPQYCPHVRGTLVDSPCLLNRLFRRRSKETSKLRVIGLCEGNSVVTGEFPTQRTSNAENVSIWWRRQGKLYDSWYLSTIWCEVMTNIAPHPAQSWYVTLRYEWFGTKLY